MAIQKKNILLNENFHFPGDFISLKFQEKRNFFFSKERNYASGWAKTNWSLIQSNIGYYLGHCLDFYKEKTGQIAIEFSAKMNRSLNLYGS